MEGLGPHCALGVRRQHERRGGETSDDERGEQSTRMGKRGSKRQLLESQWTAPLASSISVAQGSPKTTKKHSLGSVKSAFAVPARRTSGLQIRCLFHEHAQHGSVDFGGSGVTGICVFRRVRLTFHVALLCRSSSVQPSMTFATAVSKSVFLQLFWAVQRVGERCAATAALHRNRRRCLFRLCSRLGQSA